MRIAIAILTTLLFVEPVHAFCGFFASQSEGRIRSRTAQIALMREGTTTVLSIQRDYYGPAEDFVWIIPVPDSVGRESVRTLPEDTFEQVDAVSAPWLIELWERNPCERSRRGDEHGHLGARHKEVAVERVPPPPPVFVEDGGYEPIFVAADELLPWLAGQHYRLPDDAAGVLERSDETRFMIVKVRASTLSFVGERAQLPPIRVHYDAERFTLPTALGTLSTEGMVDLVVYVLALKQRWDVETHGGVSMPTALNVHESMRDRFPAFYETLFERTLTHNPSSFITEQAWDPSRCPRCPHTRHQLHPRALERLGMDVALGIGGGSVLGVLDERINEIVLTRLHHRGEQLPDELVFVPIPVEGANGFDSHYLIRHRWRGDARCDFPEEDRWDDRDRDPIAATRRTTLDAEADVALERAILEDVPALGLRTIESRPRQMNRVRIPPRLRAEGLWVVEAATRHRRR